MNLVYEKLLEFQITSTPVVVVTAVEKNGAGPVEVGKKMLVTKELVSYGTVGGGKLEYYAINKCKAIFKSRKPLLEKYALSEDEIIPDTLTLPMVCGGVVTLFYEYIGPTEEVIIFGGGHVGQALSNILKTLSFHTTIIDDRKAICDKMENADKVYNMAFTNYIEEYGIQEHQLVVVCTPSHTHDYHVINMVLEKGYHPKYMGMLCSASKLDDYLDKTYEKYTKDIDLSHFYAPIGLDTGGNRPEDIAISISSEILAIVNQKSNHLHMRETNHGKYRYWENQ